MTMIERVARVLCQKDCWGTSQTTDDLVEYADQGMEGRSVTFLRWERRIDAARAVIEAMREPTGKMLDAGNDFGDCRAAMPVWSAMIAAALEEDR